MVDIYPTVKRSGKYLPCRLFLYITHIGAFVPIERGVSRHNNGWITEVITIVFSRHNRWVIHNFS